jgi:CheY-like chemotaxis protein
MQAETNSSPRQSRVLVVDDEMLICLLIESILMDAGYQVSIANSIAEALSAIDAERPDLAIVDLNIKGRKAYPVADKLIAAGIPFLFATGGNHDGFAYPGHPCIAKPFNEAGLLTAVARLGIAPSGQP